MRPIYRYMPLIDYLHCAEVVFIFLKHQTLDLLYEAVAVPFELNCKEREAVQLLQCRKPFFKDKEITFLGFAFFIASESFQ